MILTRLRVHACNGWLFSLAGQQDKVKHKIFRGATAPSGEGTGLGLPLHRTPPLCQHPHPGSSAPPPKLHLYFGVTAEARPEFSPHRHCYVLHPPSRSTTQRGPSLLSLHGGVCLLHPPAREILQPLNELKSPRPGAELSSHQLLARRIPVAFNRGCGSFASH